MSHLLKALKSLETRGAGIALSPAEPAACNALEIGVLAASPPEAKGATPTPSAAVNAGTPAARIKPRPVPRVKPRPSTPQSPIDLFAGRPLMEKLTQATRLPVSKAPADASIVTASATAQAQNYTLGPVIAVNQKALDAGAALARELGARESEAWPIAEARPLVQKPLSAITTRSATLFEHRIRETLLHPARSRPFAELVQRLRQDFRGTKERSLLFTGIGTSSRGDEMLAHVAALFAEEGERVLLVDADFERTGLTAGFGAGTLGGLQNVLAAPRIWQDNLLKTSFDNLLFLPAGRGNLNTATAGDALSSLIPKLEAEYPLVLIDGGQSSGTLLLPMARSCDATYFVIRLGATDAKEAQGALKSFRTAGARVMGCVATMDGA